MGPDESSTTNLEKGRVNAVSERTADDNFGGSQQPLMKPATLEEGLPSRKAITSHRARRMLLHVLLLVALALWVCKWYLLPQIQEEWEMKEGFLVQSNVTYDITKHESSKFDGERLRTLDPSLLPGGSSDPEGKRRLVFIGDIHGCAKELKKLLKHLDFDQRTDHIVAVGDLISKGPKNVEVLDMLIEYGADSVRGNHEDRILALAPAVFSETTSSDSDVEELSKSARRKDKKLLRSLHKRHLQYLQSLPLMLRIPTLPMGDKPSSKKKSPIAEDIIVVHAGLVPAVPLEKQDPFYVMNMRSMTAKKHLPLIEAASKKAKSKPWHHIWAWYNDRLYRKKSLKDFEIWDDLERDEDATDSWLSTLGLVSTKKWPRPQVVVYGHHAKAGLQIDRWSKGLDTGCVRGGKLTAMVLDARGRQELVHVGCKDHR